MNFLFPPLERSDASPLPPLEAVGGKGFGLYWLAAHGFPTPPTWTISTFAFDQTLQRMGLHGRIAELEEALLATRGDWAAIQKTLERLEPLLQEIVSAIEQAPLLDRIGQALEKLTLMPTQWAVRSSATTEDSPDHSFAGQFLSLLSVPQGTAIWNAIRKVWASTFGRKALSYCAQNRVPIPRMAVILQPMPPITERDRSGVIFSHSPVESIPGVLIQATFGTGETVVKGYGGDLYSVQGNTVRVHPMPPAHIQVTAPDGYTVPAESPTTSPLTEDEARHLADLALQASNRWGGPVNIEFVWRAEEGPLFVQVRSAH